MVSTSSDLIDGVRRHDPLAWGRLVRIYSPLVYHWCRHRAELSAEDAADVLQEVFASVARSIGEFERRKTSNENGQPGTFRGWLRVLTSNKIHDFHRRNAHQTQATGGSDAIQRLSQVPDLFPGNSDSESPASGEEICEQSILINRLLDELRPRYKEESWKAFWQSELAGRPRQEIANELGMSIDAVNMAIFRIRKRLREELEGFLEE